MKKRFKVFGQRFCTYCGKDEMYYIDYNGRPLGLCDCGNVDYCDHDKTEADVKKRYGTRLKPADIDVLILED